MPTADIGTILVTRSEPGASQLAGALQRAGYQTLQCPMLDIRRIEGPEQTHIVTRLDRYDVVVFVSTHAVRFGFDLFDAVWPQRPSPIWIAVGDATARALDERGIAALRPANESSEGILALPPLNHVVGRRILICAGRGGRSLLADELVRRGARVERLELYSREPVSFDFAATRLLDIGAVGAVVVSSVDGARTFAAIWREGLGDDAVAVIAPSARVAAELNELKFSRVVIAHGAGATAVIDALNKLTGNGDE